MKEVAKMMERMIGAAMLKASVFEDIEADSSALPQAIGIVALVTLCGVVASALSSVIAGEGQSTSVISGVLSSVMFGLIGWVLWVTVLLFVGGVMLRKSDTETNWAEMGRIVGFAYTPGLLVLLSFIPTVGVMIAFIARIWTLMAVVVGIRHALDFESTGRAILVAAISGVIGSIPWLTLKFIQWIVTS